MRTKLTQQIALNTLFQLIGKLSSSAISFLITYLIISLSGFSLYGDYLKTTSLIFINFTFIDFGINAIAVKLFKTHHSHQNLFSQLIGLRILLSTISFCVTLLVLHFLPSTGYPEPVRAAYRLSLFTLFFFALSHTANAFFQSTLTFHKKMVATISGMLIMLISSGISLLCYSTLQALILSFSLGYLTTALVSLFFLYPLKPIPLFKGVKSLFLSSLPLGLALLTSFLANKIDLLVLASYRTSTELGQYGFAYKLFDFLLVFPSFLLNSAYPTLLTKPNLRLARTKRLLKTLLFTSLVLSFLIFTLSFPLSLLFSKYSTSLYYLRLLSLSLPLFFLSSPLMWFLIAQNNEWFLVPVYLGGFLLNFTLNLLLVPSYGATASALITFLTEFFFVALLYLKFVKSISNGQ